MAHLIRAAALVATALLAAPPVSAREGPSGSDLDEIREAIEASRERVGRIEREERAIFDRLEEIDVRLSALELAARRARVEAERAHAAVADAEKRARAAVARLEQTRDAMSRRVVALYKAGEAGPVRVLFSSTSLREMLGRLSSLRAVVEVDASLVARYRRDRDADVEARREAEDAAARRVEAVEVLSSAGRALASERGGKRELLARVREDRTDERALLVGLERAARALEETLARLGETSLDEDESLDGSGFAKRKGSLPAPVDASVAQPFGRVVDAEFLTQTFRKGVEFGAAAGDSVRAVAEGQVRFAGWFRGYGRIVILDHGDQYFTVSGHLDELFVDLGDRVQGGDTIATAGETGSLTGPRLYFEIRRGSQPMDPAEWLGGG